MPSFRQTGTPGTNVVSRSDDTDITPLDELGEDSLVRRLAAAPSLHGTDGARSRVTDWLAEIADTPAGKALGRLREFEDAIKTGL